jgi:hypothetical protein
LEGGRQVFWAQVGQRLPRGSFDRTDVGLEPSQLVVDSDFSRYGLRGSIQQFYGDADGSALTGARWPISEECSFGVTPVLDEQVEPSVESLLRLVRGTAPLTLINADGVSAPAELAVNAVPQTACFMPNWVSSTLEPNAQDLLNVDAELTSSSAALPGPVHLPVLLFGTFTPGAATLRWRAWAWGSSPAALRLVHHPSGVTPGRHVGAPTGQRDAKGGPSRSRCA